MRNAGNVEKAFLSMILAQDLGTADDRGFLYSESGGLEESAASLNDVRCVSFSGQMMGAMLIDGLDAYERLEPVFDDLRPN